jgi:hypothetical protein
VEAGLMRRLIIPQSGTLIMHDSFTGADGTILDRRKPDVVNLQGSAWEKDNDYDLELASNKLTYTLASPEGTDAFKETDHCIEAGTNAVTIECDINVVNLTDSVNHAVLLRYIDSTSHIAVMWQTVSGSSQSLTIRKQEKNGTAGGVSTNLDSDSMGGGFDGVGTESTLRIVDDGTTITSTLNGYTVTTSDTAYAHATKVGVKCNDFNSQTWDNFKVWKT